MKRSCLALAFVFAALQSFTFGGTIPGDAHAAVVSKIMRIDGSTLSFSSAGAEQLRVELYDVQGRKISDVFNKTYEKGNYSIHLASLAGNITGERLLIMKIRKGNEQLVHLCIPAGGRDVLQKRNTGLAAHGTGAAIAASLGSDIIEILPNSGVFLYKNTPTKSVELLQKVLSAGYSPSEEEKINFRYCPIVINKDGRFVDIQACILIQIIQDEVNTTASYTLSNGLDHLQQSVICRDVTAEEIKSMQISAEKKTPNK